MKSPGGGGCPNTTFRNTCGSCARQVSWKLRSVESSGSTRSPLSSKSSSQRTTTFSISVAARFVSISSRNKCRRRFSLHNALTYARLGIHANNHRSIPPAYCHPPMITFLFLATCFLAYSNGANDNFKGVASLFGSRTTSYPTAIFWATLTTGAGSIAATFLAQSLLKKFSGKGLVPDALTAQPEFLLAVTLGAGATVILATLLGFPISTTHGLTGALVGAGVVAARGEVNFAALGQNFVTPLLLSPVIALLAGAGLYGIFRALRLAFGINKEMCICIGAETQVVPVPLPSGLFDVETWPRVTVTAGETAVCLQRYTGTFLGVSAGRLVDVFHFLSAGAVSFARGLNDTPKMAALLLVATALDIQWGLVAVAVAI